MYGVPGGKAVGGRTEWKTEVTLPVVREMTIVAAVRRPEIMARVEARTMREEAGSAPVARAEVGVGAGAGAGAGAVVVLVGVSVGCSMAVVPRRRMLLFVPKDRFVLATFDFDEWEVTGFLSKMNVFFSLFFFSTFVSLGLFSTKFGVEKQENRTKKRQDVGELAREAE